MVKGVKFLLGFWNDSLAHGGGVCSDLMIVLWYERDLDLGSKDLGIILECIFVWKGWLNSIPFN